ncbi:MAG: ketopantoate reductase family protein [Firmicutes bacterium]|nr:ketopantoate reductase family protein [Bacillota bacterium]
MGTIRRVYLIGLGAIGSAYAAKMAEVEPGLVKVIVDAKRRAAYQQQAVMVNGVPYRFPLVTPEEAVEKADLILIAVKGYHLAEAALAIKPFVGEGTIILSLLNGITSEEELGRLYGPEKLLYSFVVATDATREGRATRYSTLGRIVFGERENKVYSSKVQMVKELFDRTGVPYEIPGDMLRELWWKFLLNVGVNQVSAVLRAPYGAFHKVEEVRALTAMACREVVQIARRIGINLKEDDIAGCLRVIDGLAPEGKTSMLQDVEAGRKTEVESFAGAVVALGEKYGVPTPVNACLKLMITAIERTYPQQKGPN